MPTHIENAQEGLSFDLPDITQGELEAFFRAERGVRRGSLASDQEVLTAVSDSINTAIRTAMKQNLAPTGPELALLVQRTAQKAILVVTQVRANTETTESEQTGAYARAAARLGWLGDTTEAQISDWRPGRVSFVVEKVADAIGVARKLPPN